MLGAADRDPALPTPFQVGVSSSNMRVQCFTNTDDLAPLAADWDQLAGAVPFRSWEWLSTWWSHYGDDHHRRAPVRYLFTLGVFDNTDRLVGIAPWYAERSRSRGRVLRFLGSGEVCSDYMSILCNPGAESRVVEELAQWLSERGSEYADDGYDRWDMIELTGVDAQDKIIERFSEELAARDNKVHSRPGQSCWRIALPTSWDEFLALLSKDHRKKVRRMWRTMVDTGRAVLHTVERKDDLQLAWEILVDLHQLRRLSLGDPGCFTSRQFADFHQEVAPKLLRNGQLLLHWIELDGRPVAAEYHLGAGGVVYAYQAGMEPEALHMSPGRLAHCLTLRRAIEQGYQTFDFLRGDEAYKAHWRAEPRGSLEIRIAPARTGAQLRFGLWLAGSNAKRRLTGKV